MNILKKSIWFGETKNDESFGHTGILQFLDYKSYCNLSLVNKIFFQYCLEFQTGLAYSSKRIFFKNFNSEKKKVLKERGDFLEKRSKLPEEEKENLDKKLFELFVDKGQFKECVELYNKGASLSKFTDENNFHNFPYYLRRKRNFEEEFEKDKIFLNSIIDYSDLNKQLADYTEQETFCQILFLLEFGHMTSISENKNKYAYLLLYHLALNFDPDIITKEIIETPYYEIFNQYNYCFDFQSTDENDLKIQDENYFFKDENFFLIDENKKEILDYQLKFIDLLFDHMDKLAEHPNKTSNFIMSEHYNILLQNYYEYEKFYEEKFKEKKLSYENDVDKPHPSDYQEFEKIIKIFVTLLPIFYQKRNAFYRELLDKLFLKFKGLVFKYMENNKNIPTNLKNLSYDYLFSKYFGIKLGYRSQIIEINSAFYSENLVRSPYFKSLETEYFQNETEIKFLYECTMTFLNKKGKHDIIQRVFKFEKENNFYKYNTINVVNPLHGNKVFNEEKEI